MRADWFPIIGLPQKVATIGVHLILIFCGELTCVLVNDFFVTVIVVNKVAMEQIIANNNNIIFTYVIILYLKQFTCITITIYPF